jgi:hypothetical protein
MKLNTIYNEDCLETMKRMPDNFVDLVLTDPPYGIRISRNPFRGKFPKSDWDDAIPSNVIFEEINRVSRHQVIWGGNYFANRLDVTNEYKMDEIKYVPLSKFQIEPTLDDKFWEEKVKRSIQDCDSVSALKEIATLLARIATQRQGVIRGLVQDMFIFNNVAVETDGLSNPDVNSK